jgi:hypothetical protein
VTHQKQEVTSPFFEGSFTAFSKRANIQVPLNVYVNAATPAALNTYLDALTNACDQPNFSVEFQDSDSDEYWDCTASDYTVSAPVELRHARMALVKISLVRLPGVRRV